MLAERQPHKLVERRQLAEVRIGRIARLRIARLVRTPRPEQLYPLLHADLSPRTRAEDPRLVVSLTVAREWNWPDARRAVSIDDSDERARPRFLDLLSHRASDDVMLLVDHPFRLVRVDLGAAAIRRINNRAKKVFRLPHRDAVQRHVDDAVTELRIKPKCFDIGRIVRHCRSGAVAVGADGV